MPSARSKGTIQELLQYLRLYPLELEESVNFDNPKKNTERLIEVGEQNPNFLTNTRCLKRYSDISDL